MNKHRSPLLSSSHILYSLTATFPWQQCPTGYTWESRENRKRDQERGVGVGWWWGGRKVSPWKSKPGQGFDWHHMGRPADWQIQLALCCPAAQRGSHDNCIPQFTGCLLGLPLANSQTVIINTDDATLPLVLRGQQGQQCVRALMYKQESSVQHILHKHMQTVSEIHRKKMVQWSLLITWQEWGHILII